MKFLARRFSIFTLFSVLLVLGIGCRSEGPTPASSKESATPEVAVEKVEQVEQDTPFELEPGFDLLTRDSFEAFDSSPDTWSAVADGISCSGKPRGYLYSKQPYQNFTMRLEYRFPRPANLKNDSKFKGNTGFLVYVNEPHKLWPICLEVQGKYIQIAAIKENGGAEPVTVEDNETARQTARKPVGQWNHLEIFSKDGSVRVSLNGTHISSSKPGTLVSGLIGIQAEDHPFEVRRMRIHAEQ
jgi:hypothetical protein